MEASQDNAGAFLDFSTLFVDLACSRRRSRSPRRCSAPVPARSGPSAPSWAESSPSPTPATSASSASPDTAGASTDGGAPRAALGYVVARNVMAGTITVSAVAMGGPAGTPRVGWPTTSFSSRATATPRPRAFSAWLPVTAPGATDNFYGGQSIVGLEAVRPGLQRGPAAGGGSHHRRGVAGAAREGRPRHFITNYGSEAALLKAMGARREYVDWKSEDGEIGFRGVVIQGPSGPYRVLLRPQLPGGHRVVAPDAHVEAPLARSGAEDFPLRRRARRCCAWPTPMPPKSASATTPTCRATRRAGTRKSRWGSEPWRTGLSWTSSTTMVKRRVELYAAVLGAGAAAPSLRSGTTRR